MCASLCLGGRKVQQYSESNFKERPLSIDLLLSLAPKITAFLFFLFWSISVFNLCPQESNHEILPRQRTTGLAHGDTACYKTQQTQQLLTTVCFPTEPLDFRASGSLATERKYCIFPLSIHISYWIHNLWISKQAPPGAKHRGCRRSTQAVKQTVSPALLSLNPSKPSVSRLDDMLKKPKKY